MDIPKMSPWGKVQQYEFITPWLVQVHTASHGGLKLERNYNNLIPAKYRSKSGWYEEDCEVYIVGFYLHAQICKEANEKKRSEIERQIADGSIYNGFKRWFVKGESI